MDARRAMALVEQPDVADGADGGGSYASPRAGAAGRQGADGSSPPAWEASKGGGVGGIGGGRPDDAAALVRRAKALGVPPLPPDLGAVRWAKQQTERWVLRGGQQAVFLSHIGFEVKGGPSIGRKISSYTAYSKPSRCGLEELPVHQNIEHERSFFFCTAALRLSHVGGVSETRGTNRQPCFALFIDRALNE